MDQQAVEAETVVALRLAGSRFAFVHGSRAGDGEARVGSDLDIAAWWGREVTQPWGVVVVPDQVDLLVLDAAPLELAGRVATAGRLLFDDDPPARVRWQALTRKMYFDEQHRQERLHRVFVTARLGGQHHGR